MLPKTYTSCQSAYIYIYIFSDLGTYSCINIDEFISNIHSAIVTDIRVLVFFRGDVLGVVIGVLLLPWGCVGGSYWGSSSAVGDVLGGVVIGVLLLPWGMCWG